MSNLPINSKDAQIIQFLYKKSDDYLSSTLIGEHISVSDRTVRKYIKNIKQFLPEHGGKIETKKGYGFKLKVTDSVKFNRMLEELSSNRRNPSDVLSMTEAKDRERFILNKIFLENQLLTVDEYAIELFVSTSTIMHALQNIRNFFSHYDLTLRNNVNEGVSVEGPEIEKRRFILNYFFDSKQIDYFMDFNHDHFAGLDLSIESLFIIVLEECRNGAIQLSDYVLQNLVVHLALAIVRIKAGKTIDSFRSKQSLDISYEIEIADRIVKRVETLADVTFPDDEANYIALHLKSKSKHDKADDPEASKTELQNQIIEVLSLIEESSEMQFSMDPMLVMGLEAHFEPLLTRLKMDIPLKNPLYEEVYEKYAPVFNETKRYFSQMPLLKDFEIDNHEWAYITLHMLASVERFRQSQRLKVIVICSTGMGSAQMLRNRLENEFGQSIQIVDVISYYQLNESQLEDVNLIVSTIDISVSFFSIPVVRVSVFLTESDIAQIDAYIKDRSSTDSFVTPKLLAENHALRLFDTYFSEDRYLVTSGPQTRDTLLKELVSSLTGCQTPSQVNEFIKHIELRERFGSLAFSDTIAFPHPSIALTVHSEMAIAIVPEGMYWDEDHQAVKFIILMSPSKVMNKGLSQVTDYFVDLIDNEADQAELLEEPSFEHFKEKFIKNHTKQKEK